MCDPSDGGREGRRVGDSFLLSCSGDRSCLSSVLVPFGLREVEPAVGRGAVGVLGMSGSTWWGVGGVRIS